MLSRLLAAAVFLLAADPAAAAPRLGNHTQLSFSAGHGPRIEYLGADGRAWRWTASHATVLPGGWKFDEADICFSFGAGSGWQCVPYELYRITVLESRSGDVFRLTGRQQVPFTLPRQRLTIKELLTRS